MTESDRKSINAFLFTCHQMRETSFGKMFSVSPAKTYRIQANTPYSTKIVSKFSPDEWTSFLVSFRKLLLNDDPGNIFRILNILSRNGDKNDQLRIREIKRNLKEAETSPGYGVQIFTKNGEDWKPLSGKRLLDSYINEIIFHNNSEAIENQRLSEESHPFSMASMFHYVIYMYKQALRIEGAVRLRNNI